MALPPNPRAKAFGNIYSSLGETPGAYGFKTDMDAVRAKDAELRAYLGTTDYAAQNKEATDFAKLQFALSLMGRGFSAMGATPQPGESPVGTLGRTLVAPVAADASAIAGPLMKQRAATRLAEQQEDRQRKLAAYTAEGASAKDKRALALDLLGKPVAAVAAGLSAGDYNLVDKDGSIFTVGDQTPVFRGISKGPDIGKFLNLGSGRIISPADLKEQGLSPRKITATTAVAAKISDTGLARRFELVNGKLIPGPIVETKAVFKDNKMAQVRVDTGENITLGTGEGQYQMYEKPPADKAPTKPWGLDDPDFKATLAGYLASMGGRQDRLGIGKVGVRFVPGNYDPEKGLDPADPKFPFVRADGAEFTQADKKKFADRLTAAYFNVFEAIKAGESRVDLNKAFTEQFFKQNAPQLGLTKAPAGLPVNPEAVRTEAGATAFYKRAPSLFAQQNDAANVLQEMPWPVRGKNFSSGVGKLKLFEMAGVPFGPGTKAPPPAADVMEGADQVRALDRGNIQQRILAERISNGTSLAGKLSQSATPRRDDQLSVVGKALSDKTNAMAKTQGSPASLQAAQLFAAGLDGVERLDRMDASAKISGAQGFIKGPAVGLGLRLTGKNFLAWLQTAKEDEATRDFVAGIPVLQELFSRQLVKAVEGEGARVSTADVVGVKKTLSSLNEDVGYSAAKLQELRRHLVNSIKYAASQLGDFKVPDATLEQAARLGIDLKAITGKSGYYSPYLNNGKYAVSKDQVPEFSKKYQDSLRTQGLFEYVSDRGRVPTYRLIQVAKDPNGVFQPVKKKDGSFATFILGKNSLNNAAFKDAVDFNRNWLRKTYNLP